MSLITKTDEKILTTLTYVGLTLSIIGIILTIISYALFTLGNLFYSIPNILLRILQKIDYFIAFFQKKCISGCFFCISFIYSEVRQPLSQVRLSLAASLGTGQIIFLAGINAKGDEVSTSF